MTASTLAMLRNRVFDEIAVGDSAAIERTLTLEDIQLFALQTGDLNPQHVDQAFAADTPLQGVVAHGMWVGSLFSAVLGAPRARLEAITLMLAHHYREARP